MSDAFIETVASDVAWRPLMACGNGAFSPHYGYQNQTSYRLYTANARGS